jgi:SAM-dependent methyltransferase
MAHEREAMPSDPYASIARWYDLEHDTYRDDIQFYLDIAAGAGPHVLEVGCGTGRITAALAEAGRMVVGVDLSKAMLAQCQRRLDRLPVHVAERVRLVCADARKLVDIPVGPYSLALIPLNTLAHFATPSDRCDVLTQIRQHLAPGARLAIDLDLEGPRRLCATAGQLWHLGTWELGDEAGNGAVRYISHFASAVPGPDGDSIVVTHFYDSVLDDGQVQRSVGRMTIALCTRNEAQLALEQAGYIIEAVYGSFDLDEYETGAERAIVVARSVT